MSDILPIAMQQSNLKLTKTEIEEAIKRHDDPEHEDANTVEGVATSLADINTDIIEHIDLHRDAIEDGVHEIVHEDSDVMVLADSGHFWGEQFDAMEIDEEQLRTIVVNLHHVAARNVCNHSWVVATPIVIFKTEDFKQAW